MNALFANVCAKRVSYLALYIDILMAFEMDFPNGTFFYSIINFVTLHQRNYYNIIILCISFKVAI